MLAFRTKNMNTYKKAVINACILAIVLLQFSCRKYLDQKPDLTKAVPGTLQDCQVLLDNYDIMNSSYPDHGEVSADNFYLTNASYNSLGSLRSEDKDAYIWLAQGQHSIQYTSIYKTIYNSNLVLQTLEKFSSSSPNYNTLKGSALFFRGFALYAGVGLFTKAYNSTSSSTDPGIPIKLSPNLDEKSERGSVEQTYNRIIQDLKDAAVLLPATTIIKSRPNKTAAYAALARVYLTMDDYINAGKMAEECLKLQNTLINYNSTSSTPTESTVTSSSTGNSFQRFNAEVIFQAMSLSGIMTQTAAKIEPTLYALYSGNDRRKSVFFKPNLKYDPDLDDFVPDGTYVFRGNYDGRSTGPLFCGLATDEIYLILAESLARQGNTQRAMDNLNTLMRNRIAPPYQEMTATSPQNALEQILAERRKELIFRTLRWADLKRLNKDPKFAVTLRRPINTITYTPLEPNDLRYAMLIPLQVINTTGIQQNPR